MKGDFTGRYVTAETRGRELWAHHKNAASFCRNIDFKYVNSAVCQCQCCLNPAR